MLNVQKLQLQLAKFALLNSKSVLFLLAVANAEKTSIAKKRSVAEQFHVLRIKSPIMPTKHVILDEYDARRMAL